jgi:two-component system, OmpR family, alkaline phosphatase synthesis response regulator PhoP
MGETAKILIVDDDVAFAESNRDLLEACGYEVYLAQNGREGLALARELRPDVMVLDVMMTTDTEGFEVARRIPESPELRNMGVLLVTGMTRALQMKGVLQPDDTWLPVDRVLEKPIPPDRLIAEVERVLKRRRAAASGGGPAAKA